MKLIRIPWHVNTLKIKDKLKLIIVPLVISLLLFCISLNVLIYVLTNSKVFSDLILVIAYISAITSAISFILFLLAIIYANFIFLLISVIAQFILSLCLANIMINFWMIRESELVSANLEVFQVFKYLFTGFCFILIFLEIELISISAVLGKLMYRKGGSWDLDDMTSIQNNIKSYSTFTS